MVEVMISSIRVSLMTPVHVIILKEVDGPRRLPIFIGRPEGDAIVAHLNGHLSPRPMTHDLLASLIAQHLNAQVTRVVITRLHQKHFYAAIYLSNGSVELELDARPSDAIALAVRSDSPIYVAEEVMEMAGTLPPTSKSAQDEGGDLSVFDEFLDSLDLGDDEGNKS